MQAQQLQKSIVKTTKPVTLPPFSIRAVHGFTKLKGHVTRLNMITEPIIDNHLPQRTQCTPTYCILELCFNSVNRS